MATVFISFATVECECVYCVRKKDQRRSMAIKERRPQLPRWWSKRTLIYMLPCTRAAANESQVRRARTQTSVCNFKRVNCVTWAYLRAIIFPYLPAKRSTAARVRFVWREIIRVLSVENCHNTLCFYLSSLFFRRELSIPRLKLSILRSSRACRLSVLYVLLLPQ